MRFKISEVPRFMQAIHALFHRKLELENTWWSLSKDSPDWYGPYHLVQVQDPHFPCKSFKQGQVLGGVGLTVAIAIAAA